MERVGIRGLRQNASQYVRRAAAGETLEVTDRGRPVAHLTPLPQAGNVLDRLIAEGKATPARHELSTLGPPPPPRKGAQPLSAVLDELRADRL